MAFSNSLTISFRARICPSLSGDRVRASRNASANAGGATFKETARFAIAGHSAETASSMWRRSRFRICVSGSPGKLAASSTTVRIAIDCHPGTVELGPYLKDGKYDQQSEMVSA
jgi:hypothetical protein